MEYKYERRGIGVMLLVPPNDPTYEAHKQANTHTINEVIQKTHDQWIVDNGLEHRPDCHGIHHQETTPYEWNDETHYYESFMTVYLRKPKFK